MGDNMITNRKYLVYVIVFVLLLIVLTAAGTYAFFKMQIVSEYPTIVGMEFGCIDVTYSESNTIDLEYQYPISDEYAIENLTPITINVTNNCSTNGDNPIYYALTLTSLSNANGYIPDNKIRILVKRTLPQGLEETIKIPTYLSSLTRINSGPAYNQTIASLNGREDTQDFTNKNIYKIDYWPYLLDGQTVEYKVYIWLDYYEGDTTHTGLNDNSTEGLDFKAATTIDVNVSLNSPQYHITQNNSDFITIPTLAQENEGVDISPVNSIQNYEITSFKVNGEAFSGYRFPMPNHDVTITDIVYEQVIFNITENDSDVDTPATARVGDIVTLTGENHKVMSFKMNGTLITGNSFVMPNGDAVITEIEKFEYIVVETETHSPIPAISGVINYYENTFEGATSIEYEIIYGTYCGTSWSYVDVYNKEPPSGTLGIFRRYTCSGNTEKITMPGNYIRIDFYNRNSGSAYLNYYGFKVKLAPNYD